jgi:hypothetical protein
MFTFLEYGETMNVQTQPDLTEFEFALFAAILSAHQNRERIVGCARAGGRVDCPQAVGEFQQDFSSRTGDALRIGKVFVHDPVKCVE